MNRIQFLLSTSLLGCAVAPPPAFAQEVSSETGQASNDSQTVQEVVVTAERRVSTAQKTAASVSVRSGEDMLVQGRYDLKDILEDVPGVEGGAAENAGTSRGATDNPAAGIIIRGIQSNLGGAGSALSPAASAALYVDDVYNGVGGNYDIDRVEVLRGPQGTLYGRSATSGVVAIHTTAPDLDDLGGTLSAEVGNYGRVHVTGALNLPLIDDKLALRVSGNHYDRSSYYATQGGGRHITNEMRAKLLYKPTDHFSAILGVAFQKNRFGSDGVTVNQTPADTYTIISYAWEPNRNEYRQYWGVFDLDLGKVALTYIPAYKTWKADTRVAVRGGTLQADQIGNTPKDHFLTQELRVRSNDDSPFQWQTGATYYKNSIRDFTQVNAYPSGALTYRAYTDKQTEQLGFFAESNWTFAPGSRLTTGLRYDHTKVVTAQEYTSSALVTKTLTAKDGARKYDNVTYKLRLERDLTPVNRLYAMVSSGFTPGDVTVVTNAQLQPEVSELKAQTLTAYEVGSKNRFADGQLQVNGAAFYYDYGGYQVANINLTPGTPTRTFHTIAVPVTTYGAELELQARPWANGRFSANVSYTKAAYHDIPATYQYLFAFNDVPGVPPYEANAAYTHTVRLGPGTELKLSGDVRYTSTHYVTRIPRSYVQYGALDYSRIGDKYVGDLNATLELDGGRLSITGYVRNVTDERYKQYRPGLGTTVDSATRVNDVNVVGSTVTLSDPRTYGLVVTGRF